MNEPLTVSGQKYDNIINPYAFQDLLQISLNEQNGLVVNLCYKWELAKIATDGHIL